MKILLLVGCGSRSGNPTKSNECTSLIDTPRSFVKNFGVKDSNKLFAFVGEKLSVERLPHERGSMDGGFKAKYAILQKIYGSFPYDTIEFVAYDHYGIPPFSNFKHVLLYVGADSGMYYHEKYMYNDVYRTKNGRWACKYAAEDYKHAYNRHTKIKPVKIDFAERVKYLTMSLRKELLTEQSWNAAPRK